MDFKIADDLRSEVVAARPKQGSKRKKMTADDEAFIISKVDLETGTLKDGWTGVAIGKHLGFSNSHINSWIRKNVIKGYRKDHLKAAVNAGRRTNIYADKEAVEAQIKAEVEATDKLEELIENNEVDVQDLTDVETPTADVEVEDNEVEVEDNEVDDDNDDQSADA